MNRVNKLSLLTFLLAFSIASSMAMQQEKNVLPEADSSIEKSNAPAGLDLLLNAHECPLTTICTDNAGQLLLTGSEDGVIKIWSPLWSEEVRCRALKMFREDRFQRSFLNLLPAEILLEVARFSVNDMDPFSYECVATLTGHKQTVRAACFGIDGLLFTSSDDETIRIWQKTELNNPQTYDCIATLFESAYSLQVDTAGRLIFASYSGSIKIAERTDPEDPRTFKCIQPLALEENGAEPVPFCIDAHDVLYMASPDTGISIFQKTDPSNPQTYALVTTLETAGKVTFLCIDSFDHLRYSIIRSFVINGRSVSNSKIGLFQKTKADDLLTYEPAVSYVHQQNVCALCTNAGGAVISLSDTSLNVWFSNTLKTINESHSQKRLVRCPVPVAPTPQEPREEKCAIS